MSRMWLISDGQWEVLEGLLPSRRPVRGGPRRDHRQVVGGSSTGSAGVEWRGLPECYGPWRTGTAPGRGTARWTPSTMP